VETTRHLASLAKVHNAHFIYISTDYVFDGTHPPYNVDSLPNPLNLYGRTKYQGELAVQQVQAKSCIVRIPVLYGPVEYNGESAINVLVDAVRQTEKRQEMDHYAVRYPTHVQDVASVCNQLVTMENVPSVVHCSAQEAFTKYEMSVLFAEYLNLPTDHLVPVTDAPKGPVDRPHNCHMSIDSLKSAGIHVDFTGFKEWWQNQF
jgi:S-adenosylmethionine synthetase